MAQILDGNVARQHFDPSKIQLTVTTVGDKLYLYGVLDVLRDAISIEKNGEHHRNAMDVENKKGPQFEFGWMSSMDQANFWLIGCHNQTNASL